MRVVEVVQREKINSKTGGMCVLCCLMKKELNVLENNKSRTYFNDVV